MDDKAKADEITSEFVKIIETVFSPDKIRQVSEGEDIDLILNSIAPGYRGLNTKIREALSEARKEAAKEILESVSLMNLRNTSDTVAHLIDDTPAGKLLRRSINNFDKLKSKHQEKGE